MSSTDNATYQTKIYYRNNNPSLGPLRYEYETVSECDDLEFNAEVDGLVADGWTLMPETFRVTYAPVKCRLFTRYHHNAIYTVMLCRKLRTMRDVK